MALQTSGSGAFPALSMSATDISVELGNSSTELFDFQGAATSFSGILDDNAISALEFYNKTFAGGSGTYGTRNSHTFRFLNIDAQLQGFADGELVAVAENDDTHLPGDHTIQGQADFVDDFVDDDLTNGDTIFANAAGSILTNLRPGGDFPSGTHFMLDTTSDKVFQVDTNADVSNVTDRTPATPSASLESKDATSITIGITGSTVVTRQYAPFKDGTEQTNILPSSSGSIGDTTTLTSYTYSGLASNTSFALKVRGENAFANGSDSNTLNITTDSAVTAWSNLTGDPQNLLGANGGSEVSNAASIDLANGSGDTVITLSDNSVVGTLQIAYSTSGDPGAAGTSNGGSGFGNSTSHRTIDQSTFSSGTLHFRTRFTHTSNKDGTGSYTVTFTNDGEANGDFNGNLTFGL
tara:strand:- start:61 stop:1287 length:1227 start_codon:yes stop_codon:yes gene_type:complete